MWLVSKLEVMYFSFPCFGWDFLDLRPSSPSSLTFRLIFPLSFSLLYASDFLSLFLASSFLSPMFSKRRLVFRTFFFFFLFTCFEFRAPAYRVEIFLVLYFLDIFCFNELNWLKCCEKFILNWLDS